MQHQLILQWNLHWNHCHLCGTMFLMGRGFVVQLVPPLDLKGIDFTPLEFVRFPQPPMKLRGG